jgi:uncharacterized protein with PIN domain
LINTDKHITIRFYEELNDFLPKSRKKRTYNISFLGNPTIKDIIESQGVPHTEIDMILVNGTSVEFNYHIRPMDKISVYPVFELLDISAAIRLRPQPLRNTLFVADAHLGKLTRYLRMLGFDTIYKNDIQDNEIIRYSIEEKRIILTRDLGILKNSKVRRGYFIRNQRPFYQCKEVIRKFSLEKQSSPFNRCMECNGLFKKIDKDLFKSEIPDMAYIYFDEFYQCMVCRNIYWKGSHYEKMQITIERLLSP